jgi:hypothetical protein
MKRIILFISLVAIAMTSMAQDIIVTRSQTRIEGKVLEISDTEVKYNKQESPNGPSLILPTSEIVTILLANGEVVNFQPSQKTQKKDQNGEKETVPNDTLPIWGNTEHEEFTIRFKTGKELVYQSGTLLEIRNNNTYYGSVQLNKKEYAELLSYCPEAYYIYKNSRKYNSRANVFGIFSGGAILYALFMEIKLIREDQLLENSEQLLIPLGISLSFAIPCSYFFKKATAETDKANAIFNQSCAWQVKKPRPELSMSASLNGFCFTLNF